MSQGGLCIVLVGLLAFSVLSLSNTHRPPVSGAAAHQGPAAVVSSLPYISHVLVIVMENHPLNTSSCCGGADGIVGNSQAPFITQLARNYSLAENYFAVASGSLPDYLALVGGSTFEAVPCVANSSPPPTCSLPQSNLVDRIESSGRTWKAYMEDYTGGCLGGNILGGAYDYFHNVIPYFADVQNNTARCNKIVSANSGHVGLPDNALIADLNSTSAAPNFMMLIPNEYNNMHGYGGQAGSVATGDSYLSHLIPAVLGTPVFKTQGAALFITWDEPTSCNCPVPAIWVGPTVKTGIASITSYTHYSILSTLEALWNLPSLTINDAAATPMTEFFVARPGPDFMLSNYGTLDLVQGGSGYNTISTKTLGSQPAVSLSLSCGNTLPPGSYCGFSPSNYSCPASCLGNVKIATSSSTPTGSYEITVQGSDGAITNSTQFTLHVLAPRALIGDVTGDCAVNVFDLAQVAGVFGSLVGPGVDPYADITLDGRIDISDLVLVASFMGQSCS